MSEIVARGCPEELVRTAKAAAATEGLYFNEWIRRAVEEKLRRKSAHEDSATIGDAKCKFAGVLLAPVRDGDPHADRTSIEVAADEPPMKDCEACHQRCIAWGAQWHCHWCGKNFPR